MAMGMLYGFAAEPPPATDPYAGFRAVLDGAVAPDGRVSYKTLKQREHQLDAVVAEWATKDLAQASKADQLAFWVNAYNALTLAVVVDNPSIKSIKELDEGEVWKRRTFVVAGESLTLDEIEHQRIRPLGDGRIHAVLNCASRGCPPLPAEPLLGESIEEQLNAASKRWVATNAFVIRERTIFLSPIFKWFSGDFASYRKGPIANVNEAQVRGLWFIATFAGPDTADLGYMPVKWDTYDWSLNSAD